MSYVQSAPPAKVVADRPDKATGPKYGLVVSNELRLKRYQSCCNTAMGRFFLILVVGLASTTSLLAATTAPVLRSARSEHGHIKVVFSLPSFSAPSKIEVGVKRKVGLNGTFLRGVRLRENIATARTRVVRWRTREALPPGRYYVHVSMIDLAGVTDCFPRAEADCAQMWSNVLPVVVPRASS